jgi:hypothetical protein
VKICHCKQWSYYDHDVLEWEAPLIVIVSTTTTNYSPTVLSGSSFFIGRLPPVHVGNAFAVSLLASKELTIKI